MRRSLSMAVMCRDHTGWGQGATEHEWSHDGSAQQPLSGCCRAGENDSSHAPQDEQTDDEEPGIAPHHGVFVDAYRLAQAGGRKHWPPRHGGNVQVKRVGAADRKEILQGESTVSELRVECEERRALHPGKACRQDLRTRGSRELDLYMALAEGFAVQHGRERHTGKVGIRTEALQRWRAGNCDSHGCILGLPWRDP